MSGGHITTETR